MHKITHFNIVPAQCHHIRRATFLTNEYMNAWNSEWRNKALYTKGRSLHFDISRFNHVLEGGSGVRARSVLTWHRWCLSTMSLRRISCALSLTHCLTRAYRSLSGWFLKNKTRVECWSFSEGDWTSNYLFRASVFKSTQNYDSCCSLDLDIDLLSRYLVWMSEWNLCLWT